MKVLIVDAYAQIECRDIIEECKKRGIEVEIKRCVNSAIYRILSGKKDISGIILGMEVPILGDGQLEKTGGDKILKMLIQKNIDIPIFIFSTNKSEYKDEYDFVFGQIENWDVKQEEEKLSYFFNSL